MSNVCYSPLTSVYMQSPHELGARPRPIDRITIHCVVGQCTTMALGAWFQRPTPIASCNYGIGYNGEVLCSVPENHISRCSSSYANDCRAVTIEVASDTTEPYAVTKAAYNTLLDLVEDVCRRNDKRRVVWLADKAKTLEYVPEADEMIFTVHRWFANKSCPGDYLYYSLPAIAKEVTKRLQKEDVIMFDEMSELPAWARPTIEKLVERGTIKGSDGGLQLSRDMVRLLVILDREGVFDRDGK